MGDFVSYGMTNEKLNKGEKIMSQNKKRVNNPSSKMTDETINIVLSSLANDGGQSKGVLLYGNFQEMKTEQGNTYYAFDKSIQFRYDGDRYETDLLMESSKRNIKQMMACNSVRFQRRYLSYEMIEPLYNYKNQINPNIEDATYWIFKSDFPKLSDYDGHVGYHLLQGKDKQRNLHHCSTCNEYYRNYCSCLAHHQMNSYSNNHNARTFHDFVGGEVKVHQGSINTNASLANSKAFIGIELELEYQNRRKSRNETNLQILRYMKRHFGKQFSDVFHSFKSDNTINRGAEGITHPFSSDYYFAFRKGFEQLSVALSAMNCGDHNTNNVGSNLGMHIHISRDAFRSQLHLRRFLKLNLQSVAQLKALSGRGNRCYGGSAVSKLRSARTSDALQKRAENLGLDGAVGYMNDADVNSLAKKLFNNETPEGRNFWNFGNSRTYEYRLPAMLLDSTFKGKDGKAYSAMCVNMELIFGMFEYSKTNPIADMNFASFIAWLKQGKRYNNLLQMVKQDTSLLELTFGKATMLAGSDVADLANEMDVFKGSMMEQDVLDVKALKEIMARGQAIVSKLDKVDALSSDKIKEKVKAFQSNKKESK